MSHRFLRWPLAAAITTLALVASAAEPSASTSTQPKSSRPDPLAADASVPPAVHRSALDGYRANRDASLRSWKEANDEVSRIGGWRAYAREAARGDAVAAPAAGAASAPVAQPGASGAGGHKH